MRYLLLVLLILPTASLAQDGAVASSSTPTSSGRSGGGGGVTTDGDNTWTGTQTFRDNKFVITDDADTTKILNFQLSSIATATTRTYTWPDLSGTVPLLERDQTFTGTNTYSGTSAFNAGATVNVNQSLNFFSASNTQFEYRSTSTPDTLYLLPDTTSRAIHIAELGDEAFDFNNGPCDGAACSTPTLIGHSNDQVTDEWWALDTTNDGQSRLRSSKWLALQSGTGGISGAKNLTESTITDVVRMTFDGASDHTGFTINWTVVANDSTNFQSRRGSTYIAAVVDSVGAETCTPGDVGTTVVAVTSGTLTNTVTCTAVGLANAVDVEFNATSSLTQTTLAVYWSVIMDGPGLLTPQ